MLKDWWKTILTFVQRAFNWLVFGEFKTTEDAYRNINNNMIELNILFNVLEEKEHEYELMDKRTIKAREFKENEIDVIRNKIDVIKFNEVEMAMSALHRMKIMEGGYSPLVKFKRWIRRSD